MGKYQDVQKDIYSIFGSNLWKNNNIKTVPMNMTPDDNITEFIRISIIPSGRGENLKSISGIVIVDIFVESQLGPSRVNYIADLLDDFLLGKSIKIQNNKTTQFKHSSLYPKGIDIVNSSLYRASYNIDFNFTESL
jgi:hypothetical protein